MPNFDLELSQFLIGILFVPLFTITATSKLTIHCLNSL